MSLGYWAQCQNLIENDEHYKDDQLNVADGGIEGVLWRNPYPRSIGEEKGVKTDVWEIDMEEQICINNQVLVLGDFNFPHID